MTLPKPVSGSECLNGNSNSDHSNCLTLIVVSEQWVTQSCLHGLLWGPSWGGFRLFPSPEAERPKKEESPEIIDVDALSATSSAADPEAEIDSDKESDLYEPDDDRAYTSACIPIAYIRLFRIYRLIRRNAKAGK